MNFKIVLFISILTISCGLKTNPKSPKGTNLPSIESDYSTNIEINKKKSESSDKKQKKK